jgi:hypothetical protein
MGQQNPGATAAAATFRGWLKPHGKIMNLDQLGLANRERQLQRWHVERPREHQQLREADVGPRCLLGMLSLSLSDP